MRWLYKLEYKFGKYYIPNLMMYIVAGMALVFVADIATGSYVSSLLCLSFPHIMAGQLWRLITFIFVPPSSSPIWLLLILFIFYSQGRQLENTWGGFRFNVYYLFGVLGAILATLLNGLLLNPMYVGTNYFINISLLLGIITLAPDTVFRIYFIIPVQGKWLGIVYAIILLLPIVQTFFVSPLLGLNDLITLAFSLVNYVIFFGPTLIGKIKEDARIRKNRRNWRNQNR